MSWLTDLTSKAETFLNKIDQTAAEKLNESVNSEVTHSDVPEYSPIKRDTEIFIPSTVSSKVSPAASPIMELKKPPRKPTNLPLNKNNEDGKPHLSSEDASKSLSKGSSKKQDEMLFQFLNNSDNSTTKAPRSKPPHSKSTPLITAPEKSSHSVSVEVDLEPKVCDSVGSSETSATVEQPADHILEYTKHGVNHEEELARREDDRISNLELENQLLKTEVQSLNNELSRTLTRLKEKQEEADKFKLRYENRRNQQNEDYERIRSEYENKEVDLQEALKAKDSQLAVLRVRIQEVDGELKEKVKTLLEVQTQNEVLMKDHTDASGIQNVAIDSMREKLEETEQLLQQEQQEKDSIKFELMSLEEKIRNEQNEYVDTIKQLEKKQSQEKERNREFELKSKQADDEVENIRKELKDYKEKAARILQAKEKLINSLKQGSGSADLPPMLLTELEEVKQERDTLRDELMQQRYQTEQLKSEYQELEMLNSTEIEDHQQKMESLQSSLEDEIRSREHADEDMKRYMQELQFNREELHKMKKNSVIEKQQFEAEVKRLHNQISIKQNVSSSQEELENRIRTLTDSLIHKQTVVETLSTEKSSLVLQLERLEKQYYDIQKSLDSRSKERNHSDVEDFDGGGRLRSMNSIMPSQIVQNRRWKTTVNEIDKLSIRMGVFLRRYPAGRLMMLVYMLILHVWVTFVLLTYTPEIHSKDAHC